jgi:hypothetical protein
MEHIIGIIQNEFKMKLKKINNKKSPDKIIKGKAIYQKKSD